MKVKPWTAEQVRSQRKREYVWVSRTELDKLFQDFNDELDKLRAEISAINQPRWFWYGVVPALAAYGAMDIILNLWVWLR